MNCTPGDLAVVVRSPAIPRFVGLIVRVTEVVPDFPDDPHWATTPNHYDSGQPVAFADDTLRPIRDPGEDARDETLSWLPVPSTEKVTG